MPLRRVAIGRADADAVVPASCLPPRAGGSRSIRQGRGSLRMGLQINVLGPCEITVDGEPVRLAGTRRVGLLARLAMSADRVVPAEQLLTDVWGQSTAATAGKQLHIVVSKLRDLLSPHHDGEIIATVPGGYRLNLGRERVDAHLFTLLARQAGAARDRGEIAAADGLFRRALALWRGDALAGMAAPWAEAASDRLAEERLTALEHHFDVRLETGDHHAVVPELSAHAAAHPLRERPQAQLMLALYRASRSTEALAVYQETRRVLVDELGIEPGAALRRLQEAVLARDPALDLPCPAQRTAPTLPGPTRHTARSLPGPARHSAPALHDTARHAAPALHDLDVRTALDLPSPAPGALDLPSPAQGVLGLPGRGASDLSGHGRRAPGLSRPGAVVPGELPAGTRAFTARSAELAWLHETLTGAVPGRPAVAAIDGPGGIGKSALAVHAAHAAAGRFTDGVFYVDLHSATAGRRPLPPLKALNRLLRSLGDEAAAPATPDEAAARYRSLTSARNLLVILDNAYDADQVRPLIPAGPACAAIVTSRRVLAALGGASPLHLAGLGDADADALFARLVGAPRVEAEPEAAREIVRRCGGLPLALRIAAARLAARPGWTLSHLAARLNDPARRLDALEHADLAVRTSIAAGLQQLPDGPAGRDAAHTFVLLGLLETPGYATGAVSALTGWTERRTEAALGRLVEVRLLESGGPGRYRMPGLIRLYAREQAARHMPEARRAAAVRRVFHHYLTTVRAGGSEGVAAGRSARCRFTVSGRTVTKLMPARP
ncbi:hypothetical protein FH608_008735 [Nonomuraea phyllanthi]|uniref:Uncharacterized protein n=2 Tax=Nonomuraea phyllanthi TaxID=2219224 RepID=A0A5C4WT67_9ACTN|nr:hypothetical protein FH608_008735 [Nonomuraea phyllanthi]